MRDAVYPLVSAFFASPLDELIIVGSIGWLLPTELVALLGLIGFSVPLGLWLLSRWPTTGWHRYQRLRAPSSDRSVPVRGESGE